MNNFLRRRPRKDAPKRWRVIVSGIGVIGDVESHTEEAARRSAQHVYGVNKDRSDGDNSAMIFNNDVFSVMVW